ncbi:MAG: 2-oxoacid:ferredoxin oxidoreductase subunit beta [Deltaproteobacteria bacterium]|nr:2-oxoacid:ferredoxin oxidoreductase subunit beta [Deltaproteobacteria bacterium]
MSELVKLTKKDFESDQEVRWCPGCGDYSILATVQRFLPSLDIPKENHVVISGIGCSSRFPYYMNTYGFHTIHGRAPALATGVKLVNPDLHVWLITGDGDALSIGGNHFIHLLRRNVDLTVLLFNNRIYGLTKGQYSPTSEVGKKTKSTPYGSVDEPVDPVSLALGAKATFIARASAVDAKGLTAVLEQAAAHKGTSFVEIFQNCNVFNDGAFKDFDERAVRNERQLHVEHGKPLIFGAELDKGIALDGFNPKIVSTKNGSADQILTYDKNSKILAQILASLSFPEFPVPMGVLYQEERSAYDTAVTEQVAQAKQRQGEGKLSDLLNSGDTWTVN